MIDKHETNKYLKRLHALGYTLAPLGVEFRKDNEPYFCTPKYSNIIGWAGVDGIHFCCIFGYSDAVFAVSPMNAPGEYIHIVAESIGDFISLLLATGDSAALEQAWQWDREQFEAFVRESKANAPHEVIDMVGLKLKLRPMRDPYGYIHDLQQNFDYSKIVPQNDEAGKNASADGGKPPRKKHTPKPAQGSSEPRMKVYFENRRKGRIGQEIRIERRFNWAEREWFVPCIYTFRYGMAVDLCMKLCDAHGPMDIRPSIALNGDLIRYSVGSSTCYYAENEYNEDEAVAFVNGYGLDPKADYMFSRWFFPWVTTLKPIITELRIQMIAEPRPISAGNFMIQQGESAKLTHPVTHDVYTLTALSIEQKTMGKRAFGISNYEMPQNMTVMKYAVSPDTGSSIIVTDAEPGDNPRPRSADFGMGSMAAAIGVIGGADGPTTLYMNNDKNARVACSALRFEKSSRPVKWHAEFLYKEYEDAEERLM